MKKLFLLIFLIVGAMGIHYIIKPTSKPLIERPNGEYVSVLCNGQLGNQMFKIASILAYAEDNHLLPVFPSLNNEGDNLRYNRDNYFTKLNVEEPPVNLISYPIPVLNYIVLPTGMGNVLFEGGFFSWKFFHHHRYKILKVFEPPLRVLEKLERKYSDLISHPQTVSVHVRTYSKKTHETGLHFVGLDYFGRAMNQFPRDALFVVFSDRIDWSKAIFSKRFPERKFVFIEGNDHIEDLILMSKMKHHILSTSTFSWWAAYLNTHPEKQVYIPLLAPTLFSKIKNVLKPILNNFRRNPPLVFSYEDYYLPEWKIVYYNLETYPEDIYNYGDVTTSVFVGDK